MNRKFKIICQNCGEEAVLSYYSHVGLITNSKIETKIEKEKGGRVKAIIKCANCGNNVYFENI